MFSIESVNHLIPWHVHAVDGKDIPEVGILVSCQAKFIDSLTIMTRRMVIVMTRVAPLPEQK